MTRSLVAWGGALCGVLAWGHSPTARAAIAVELVVPSPGPSELEPPPAGEQAVRWALPRGKRQVVKIKAAPRRDALTLGQTRGETALLVSDTNPVRGAGCKQWLRAEPAGYVCAAEVTVRSGWLSSPPAAELATAWQRLRYGVVRAVQTQVRGGAGRFLRALLRRGDGVTVTRTLGQEVQLVGRQRLAAADVQLVTPPQVKPVPIGGLPPGQRVAWAVPPQGESLVPLYLPGQQQPAAYAPRYTVLHYSAQNYSPPSYSGTSYSSPTYTAISYSGHHTGAHAPGGSPAAPRVTVTVPEDAVLQPGLGASEAGPGRTFEIETAHLRRFTPAAPPPEIGPDERWLDISIGDQVATAYVGRTPAFATLVSTGSATRPGSFFIYRKYLTQTMANLSGASSQYDYREVPWAQFFDGRIGLHAVLWHDLLGHPVSHGCINLSPPSAQQLFAFTGPPLPPGWHSVTGAAPDSDPAALRGTRVVVRR
ncbi:MAG: L,D-transpeptidase [Polyangia bacterium]